MSESFYAEYLSASAGLPEEFRTEAVAKGLEVHLDELERVGKLFNLTAITERSEALRLHAVDSLHAAASVRELSEGGEATLLDVGSGGGFPALPIAVSCGNITVTALDSTAKKCEFISDTAKKCGVAVATVPERAEEAVCRMRESFGFVTARAVARLNILAELCAPFVAAGGYFIAMKGSAAMEEAKEAERAAKELGLEPYRETKYEIEGGGERYLLIYKKVRPTPAKYPRRYSKIKSDPLK